MSGLDEKGVATPIADLVERALARMASGEWRLILEHPNLAEGTSVCSMEVGHAERAEAAEKERDEARSRANGLSIIYETARGSIKELMDQLEAADALSSARQQIETLTRENARLIAINANLMGDDECVPRYTTKRLRQEIASRTADYEALRARLATIEAETLERAAKVAERAGSHPVGAGDGGTYLTGTALDAAAAIRSLIQKENADGIDH